MRINFTNNAIIHDDKGLYSRVYIKGRWTPLMAKRNGWPDLYKKGKKMDHKKTWPKLCQCGDPADTKIGSVYMCGRCKRNFEKDFNHYMRDGDEAR